MTFQSLILKLSEFWASRGCALQQPLDVEVGAGTMHPETFLRVLGPGALERRLRAAVAPAGRRPLRREPEPAVQAPPVSGDPQAGARRGAAAVSRQPRGVRHQPAAARHPLRGGQLGVADARRLGHRLAGDVRRHGDLAVHLLPAGRRHRAGADLGGADLRARAHRDGAAARRQRVRPRVGAGREVPRRAAARGGRAVEVRLRPGRDLPAGEFGAFHRDLFERYYQLAEALLRVAA